jgi:PAS domain S-box-containing protein
MENMPKSKIMIVEDERIVAADLEDKLVSMGYDVCGKAYSGEQTLSTAEKAHPDLVLMDIKLEGSMNGIEAAGLIKDRFGVPVIYLTAFSDEYTLQRAKVTEPFGYLLKPVQSRELRAIIEIALFKAGMEKRLTSVNAELEKTIGQLQSEIKERKYVEEALLESEERYRALSDAAFEAIFLFENGICIDANQTATKLFEYEHDELIGKLATDIIAAESKELVRNYIISGYGEPYEAITQKKDGAAFHAEIHGKLIEYKGKKVRVKVVHDIDDRKRAEAYLRDARDALEIEVSKRTAELVKINEELKNEIKERRQAEKVLKKNEKELENKTHELEEINAALNVLLKRREQDKKELEEKVLSNVKELILPYVKKLQKSRLRDNQMIHLSIIVSNLHNIVSPFLRRLSSKYTDLTPSEIQVANLVKEGKTTKEISELMNSSIRAIEFHRSNLRKKLGLANKKANLRSHLLSLS